MADRREWLMLAALSVLATIPVWLPTFPPMTDLPQHAAQVALLRNLLHPDYRFASLFRVNWFTPYLLGYLLVYALTPLLGIVAACKAVVSAALAAVPLATALVLKEVGGEKRWALLVIPASYGFTYQWGFLSFLVAAPVGLVFLWLAYRHATSGKTTTAIGLAVATNALFFCHAMICAAFAVMAGVILLSRGRTLGSAIKRALPLAAALPLMVLWMYGVLAHSNGVRTTEWDGGWFRTQDPYYSRGAEWADTNGAGWGRINGFFPRLFGVRPGVAVTATGAIVFALPLLAGARPTRRVTRWIPLATLCAILLFLPGMLLGTAYSFQRFTMFAPALYGLTLDRRASRAWPSWTWPACGSLIVGAIVMASVKTMAYEREVDGFDEVLRLMQPGQRALSLAFDRDSTATIAPTFLHFPAWYSALKDGVVDANFGVFDAPMVSVSATNEVAWTLLGFEWNPWSFDWESMGADQFRYFVARASEDRRQDVFADAPCQVRTVYHANWWWLYERDPACAPAGSAR